MWKLINGYENENESQLSESLICKMPLKLSSESWKLLYFFWLPFILLFFFGMKVTSHSLATQWANYIALSHCIKLIRKRWVGKFSTYFRVKRCRSHMPAKMNFQPQMLCWHANYAKLMCHASNATPAELQAQLVLVCCCCHCMRRLIFIFKTLNAVVSSGCQSPTRGPGRLDSKSISCGCTTTTTKCLLPVHP